MPIDSAMCADRSARRGRGGRSRKRRHDGRLGRERSRRKRNNYRGGEQEQRTAHKRFSEAEINSARNALRRVAPRESVV